MGKGQGEVERPALALDQTASPGTREFKLQPVDGTPDGARLRSLPLALGAGKAHSRRAITREHREVPWREIVELDRRIAAEHGIEPQ